MRLPTPTTPPTIAPVFDRFELEVTGALVVLCDVAAGTKEVDTSVDVVSEEVRRDELEA